MVTLGCKKSGICLTPRLTNVIHLNKNLQMLFNLDNEVVVGKEILSTCKVY